MFQQVALMNAFSNRKTAMVGWSVGLAGFVGLQMFSDQNDCLKLYVRGDRLTFRNNRITIFFSTKNCFHQKYKSKAAAYFCNILSDVGNFSFVSKIFLCCELFKFERFSFLCVKLGPQ
jgi:hypothetical protein